MIRFPTVLGQETGMGLGIGLVITLVLAGFIRWLGWVGAAMALTVILLGGAVAVVVLVQDGMPMGACPSVLSLKGATK